MKADLGLKATQSRVRRKGEIKKKKSGCGGRNKIDPTGAPLFFCPML